MSSVIKVTVALTCYNRKEKTKRCIKSLMMNNPHCEFSFVIADDGSTDGTYEMLTSLRDKGCLIDVLQGKGKWYYSGGMNVALSYVKKNLGNSIDYVMLINDDVEFLDKTIEHMIVQSKKQDNSIIVGVMKDDNNNISYGAIKYIRGIRYKKFGTEDWNKPADTFNANCVLIPVKIFLENDVIDPKYKHSLGDFDYGLSLKRKGAKIYSSKKIIGICNCNTIENSWRDKTLSRIERLKRKESIKGSPSKEWFYFLNKNFGMKYAIVGSITPFIRILIKK